MLILEFIFATGWIAAAAVSENIPLCTGVFAIWLFSGFVLERRANRK